jgi:hypothetical protein
MVAFIADLSKTFWTIEITLGFICAYHDTASRIRTPL